MTFSSTQTISVGRLVLGAALVFYLATLRTGHRAGDFAMYAQHTVNMGEGRPYAETGYFQNPAATSVGTKNYPPGLPLLLLPIYLVAGLNVTAMKILMVLLFFGALGIFRLLTRDGLGVAFSGVMLFDIAFTPYLWAFKDNVESDFPFLLPVYLSMWLISRLSQHRRQTGLWIATGLAMYGAVVIRPIGLVLPIALVLYEIIDRRTLLPGLRVWIPIVVLATLMVVQAVLLPLESGSYTSAFLQEVGSPGQLIESMVLNAKYYILACAGRLLLTNGHGTLWADVLLVCSITPFIVGFLTRVRTRIGILEVFFTVYAGVLLVWPFRQPNYLIPVIPLLSFYVFAGLERMLARASERMKTSLAALVAILLALTFGMRYGTMNLSNVPHDVMSNASMRFYGYVERQTAPDAVILSRVPREVALFTGRRSTPPNLPGENRDFYSEPEVAMLKAYIDEVGVGYVAAGPKGPEFHREVLPLWELTETDSLFAPVFQNEEWRLYQVISR